MTIWQRAVRVLGILVGLLLLADLLRSSFDWQNTAVRFAISLPLLVPWSLLNKKWSQATVYFLLWIDLLLSFTLVISFFIAERAFGPNVYPASVAVAGVAVFVVCVPSLFLMRREFSRMSEESIQRLQASVVHRAR